MAGHCQQDLPDEAVFSVLGAVIHDANCLISPQSEIFALAGNCIKSAPQAATRDCELA